MRSVDNDVAHTVFSFIPNTAEVAFLGLVEKIHERLDDERFSEILSLSERGELTRERLAEIHDRRLRVEKVAIKDIKLRTFISEGEVRNDLAAHVYDVTYGIIDDDRDNLVVLDDSIVRGTTLRQSILKMLGRLRPKKIVVVSSAPQVRYPDYYGIDMSRLSEFAAFRAAVALLKEGGMDNVLDRVYEECKSLLTADESQLYNPVKAVYAPFSDEMVASKMAEMLTPAGVDADVELIFQSLEGLHEAVADCPGDWYFSGNYPTPGGLRLLLKAYIDFYESEKR